MTLTNTALPIIALNDGRAMPQLGFGTFKIENDDAAEAVRNAVEIGYPLVDTAAVYGNERGVGEALSTRRDIWLTTKIWNDSQGYDRTLAAFDKCLQRLGRDHVDLLLIHWPCPDKNLYAETWKALVKLREERRARSIGVSNFMPDHLKRIADETGVAPAVNQIELHPGFQQRAIRSVHKDMGIAIQSWSPLGQGDALDNDDIRHIADAHDATPAQVVLAWHLRQGLLVIPKASSREHAEDNFRALDLRLTDQDMAAIDALDDPDGRLGPDPENFN